MYGYDMYDYYEITEQTSMLPSYSAGALLVPMIMSTVISVLLIVCNWKMFMKAGEKGWAAIIPIYNFIIMTKIAMGRKVYALLMLVPIVNVVFMIVLSFKYYKLFGGTAMALITMFVPGAMLITVPMMAFGNKGTIDAIQNTIDPGAPSIIVDGVIRCKNCHTVIEGIQPGQHFICGYCCTEQDA